MVESQGQEIEVDECNHEMTGKPHITSAIGSYAYIVSFALGSNAMH